MKIIAIIALAAAFVCGCSTVNTYERANPNARPQMVNDKRVITDGDLNDYAYVSGINQAYVGGNLLQIQARLVNSSSAYRTVNYKFTWIDANGMEIPSTTASWGTVMLEGGEAKNITAVATSPNAVDFTLKLLPDVRKY